MSTSAVISSLVDFSTSPVVVLDPSSVSVLDSVLVSLPVEPAVSVLDPLAVLEPRLVPPVVLFELESESLEQPAMAPPWRCRGGRSACVG